MSDGVTRWLINEITRSTCDHSMWFSDENILREISTIAGLKKIPTLMTNRWDIAQHAEAVGIQTEFSDFDCQHIADNSQDSVFYRVSKEKPVVHHIINQAFRILKIHGELIIAGQKNEGIKTYIEKAKQLFGSNVVIRKDGANYHARISKATKANVAATPLDDTDYTRLRIITELNGHPLYSKPGIFGWNKIDLGSALLIEQLDIFLPTLTQRPHSLLDLGCGYGYLSLMTAALPCTHRTLTDNNAAALAAARVNCAHRGISADVIPGDAGSSLTTPFDLILCNPPFHQGFDVDGDLTDKFLAASKRLLAPNGIAIFVVNQFIPLERKAKSLFKRIEILTETRGFKVIALSH